MPNEYTVMLLSDKGRTKFSFKTNFFVLFLFILIVLSIIFLSVFSLQKYLLIKTQTREMTVQINNLEKDIEKLSRENRESELYKKWADRIIYRRLQYEFTLDNESISEEAILATKSTEPNTEDKKTVDIDNFEIRALNLELDFDLFFNLVNRTQNNRSISGYVFIVASNQDVKPEIYSLWPQTDHVSGTPENYRKGDSFSIRYMKKVKGRIIQPSIGKKFNRVDIIVYSEDGNILLKKGYYIERLLAPPAE